MREPLRNGCPNRCRLVQVVLPRYSHPKSLHRYTLPELTTCVLLMFYLRLSYWNMEE
ncbi:MAG: hypothetical protein ACK4VW_10225 [Anaerolineales bacterium]